ncbi:hypothetical protein GCM10022276_25130 [Sphingomonas limnosediminicola]|uniref:DUF1236 domain-containing protein n=1 Tax=Sphingomonas limnosediminicola TaxID=940133 RepID=A0ABP7LQW6_9SPHN
MARETGPFLQPFYPSAAKSEEFERSKFILAISTAAVGLSASPALAEKRYSDVMVCDKVKDGVCTTYKRLTRGAAARAQWQVGHVFGPTYTYTDVSSIPPTVVTQYGIKSDGHYVYSNGYLYEIDPTTYAVTRVIYTQPQ